MIKNDNASAEKILVSTGSFIHGWGGYDHTLIEKIIPLLPNPVFELFISDYFIENPGEYDAVADTVKKAISNGARMYSMHTCKTIGEIINRDDLGGVEKAVELFQSNCSYAAAFGIKLIVLHLWNGPSSDKNIKLNISVYPRLKAIADRYNLILTVENIVCNTYRPLDHMKKLWDLYPHDIKFTIDTRHAEFHKSLTETCESSFLWDNDLVAHFHISDYSGDYMDWTKLRNNIRLASGDIDFAKFFNFLESIGHKGRLVIENGYGKDMRFDEVVADLNRSYKFIRNRGRRV